MSDIKRWAGNDCTVTFYPKGFSPGVVKPGDMGVVCDWDEDLLGRLIRAGSRARYGNTDFARWSHSFLVVSSSGDIVEANASGIQRASVRKYDKSDFILITPTSATDDQRKLVVGFALSQVGTKYDFLDFVGLGLGLLFRLNLSLHAAKGRFICSGLTSRGTEKYIVAYPYSFEAMMPTDIAVYWGAHTDQPLPKFNFFDKVMNRLIALSTLFK